MTSEFSNYLKEPDFSEYEAFRRFSAEQGENGALIKKLNDVEDKMKKEIERFVINLSGKITEKTKDSGAENAGRWDYKY